MFQPSYHQRLFMTEEQREKRRLASLEWWRKNGAAYREKNRQKLRAIATKHRELNRDKVRARVAVYQKEHPERQRQSERKYRAKHPDRRKRSVDAYRSKPGIRDRERQNSKIWAASNKATLAAKAARRRANILQATPSWANLDAIAEIYALAERMTLSTGIEHHVDHIVPLKGRLVCGLHVEGNLQVITAAENLSKLNKFEPFCTTAF